MNTNSFIFYQKYNKYKMKYLNLKELNKSLIKNKSERIDNNKRKYLNLKQIAGNPNQEEKKKIGKNC